jgi:anti-anti-sigma regulatory factor
VSALSITSVTRSTGTVVLVLRGSVGTADVDSFRAALADALRAHRPPELEIDCSGVFELDPGVAGRIASTIWAAAPGATRVTVVRAPAALRQQLRLCGGAGLLA